MDRFSLKKSPEWKVRVGSSLAPNWPTGRAANGNEGITELVKEIRGSIGYVEFMYALQNRLGFGRVRNRNGEFVGASLESIAVSVSRSLQASNGFKISIADNRVKVLTRFLRSPGLWFPLILPTTPSATPS